LLLSNVTSTFFTQQPLKTKMVPLPRFSGELLSLDQVQIKGSHALRVISANDTESIEELANMATGVQTEMKQAKADKIDTLRLHAGDFYIGNDFNTVKTAVELLNEIGFEAVTFGNHDVDINIHQLAAALLHAKFKVLASNLNIPETSTLYKLTKHGMGEKAILRQEPMVYVADSGQQYGIIGLTLPHIETWIRPDVDAEGITSASFEETCKIVQQQVKALHRKGIKRILVLSHLGKDEKTNDYNWLLQKAVKGIQVVVSGHTHEFIAEAHMGTSPTHSEFQAGGGTTHFQVTDIPYNKKDLVAMQSDFRQTISYPPLAAALAILQRFSKGFPPVARLSKPYDPKVYQETGNDPVTQLIADEIRKTTGADIAFCKSITPRKQLKSDEMLTEFHTNSALLDTHVSVVQATGSEILAALHLSAQVIKEGNSSRRGILNPSGFCYTVNKKTGDVTDVQVMNSQQQWEPLDLQKTYTVAGDFYTFQVRNEALFPSLYRNPETMDRILVKTGEKFRKLFAQALRAKAAQDTNQSVSLEPENRIQVIEA
jgi:2',3'-cyclic-nucleotide 2'-phosphodiesterase (5'-nucleotidase family)